MIFFQSSANLGNNEKARIEFMLHRLAEHVGLEKMANDVLSVPEFLVSVGESGAIDSLLSLIGQQLNDDFAGLRIHKELRVISTTGGGG